MNRMCVCVQIKILKHLDPHLASGNKTVHLDNSFGFFWISGLANLNHKQDADGEALP